MPPQSGDDREGDLPEAVPTGDFTPFGYLGSREHAAISTGRRSTDPPTSKSGAPN